MKWFFSFLISVLIANAAIADIGNDAPHGNTIALQIIAHDLTGKGKELRAIAKLTHVSDGSPATLDDLKTVHTQKFHLLIIEPSMNDYFHVHPVPTEIPGEYAFSFTPNTNYPYYAFADITPVSTGRQEFIKAPIPSAPVKTVIETSSNQQTESVENQYRFTLSFDEPLVANESAIAHLHVVSLRKPGKIVNNLEPILGSYAHVVGFHQDLQTVLHMHPMEAEPTNDADRGGPDITFHITPSKPGFYKLFAQFKIDGQEIVVPFGIKVEPAKN
jgi:hypothetical protein